jgi:hypothetical protein
MFDDVFFWGTLTGASPDGWGFPPQTPTAGAGPDTPLGPLRGAGTRRAGHCVAHKKKESGT